MLDELLGNLPEPEPTDADTASGEWAEVSIETDLPVEGTGVLDSLSEGSFFNASMEITDTSSEILLSHEAGSETPEVLNDLQAAHETGHENTDGELGFARMDYCSWCQGTGVVYSPTGATVPCAHCGHGGAGAAEAHSWSKQISFTGYGGCSCGCRTFEGGGRCLHQLRA